MDNEPQSALGHLNRGIDAFENGNPERARRHFAQALLLEPNNDVAWLWLAEAAENTGEKRYCLERATRIDPDSAAHTQLDALELSEVEAQIPAVISDLATPRLPPSLRNTSSPREITPRKQRSRRNARSAGSSRGPLFWIALLGIVLALAAIGRTLLVETGEPERPVVSLAVVAPLTGESAAAGMEIRNAATVAIDDLNDLIGDGPRIELLFFDDRGDPDLATTIARQIVADDRIVGVIGHSTSTTSMAAAPVYADANMPVITGQATTDALSDYPNYFRTIFSNRDEARILTQYLFVDLNQDKVSIVVGPSDYEQSLAASFEQEYASKGAVANIWTITDDRSASISAIIEEMKTTGDMGALFLSLTDANGYELVKQLRDAGLDPLIMGPEALGTREFVKHFKSEPAEIKNAGFYTNNMYAVSPLLFDSVGGETLAFSTNYKAQFGVTPAWRAAKTWDAVSALGTAVHRADISTDPARVDEHRAAIVSELGHTTQLHDGFRGLSGAVYFSKDGSSPQGLSIGKFDRGTLVSAPVQYRLVDYPQNYDLDAELKSGNIVEMNGYYVRRYRVVYAGIEMIELRDLSTANQSYKADFYLYFRYKGNDDPLNIVFTNATDSKLSLGAPLSSDITQGGMNYRLFRVQGTFTEPMDFSDYPWDQHQLTIRFQSPVLTQNDIVYVADPAALRLSQEERLRSGFDLSRPFNRVPSWIVDRVLFEQQSIASTVGDYDSDGITYYSEFRLSIDTQRDVNAFLLKNLLPLALLTLVTYIAIWFPAEQAGARVGFAITALLSSAVLLNAIASQLPEIGYNVAIEWGYYAYIGLSAILVLLTVAVDRAYKAKRKTRVRRLDSFIRAAYPFTIGVIVAIYFTVYRTGNRSSGGQTDIRLGIVAVLGILLVVSAVMVLWPDRFGLRSLRGKHNASSGSPAEST